METDWKQYTGMVGLEVIALEGAFDLATLDMARGDSFYVLRDMCNRGNSGGTEPHFAFGRRNIHISPEARNWRNWQVSQGTGTFNAWGTL